MRILKTTFGMVGCLLALAVLPARADTITYSIGLGNSAISGYTGPYATATVNRTDSTHATITFSALSGGGNQFLFVDGGSVAVNVNATSWTLGAITGTQVPSAGFAPLSFSNGGSGNEDGFGTFNQKIDNFDSFDHAALTVTFSLTDTSGSWLTAGDVLAQNGGSTGYYLGAHIAVTSDPALQANGAKATGFAVDNGIVPDGGTTIALLGFALVGVGALRRKITRN